MCDHTSKQLIQKELRSFVKSLNLVSLAGAPTKPNELVVYEKNNMRPSGSGGSNPGGTTEFVNFYVLAIWFLCCNTVAASTL